MSDMPDAVMWQQLGEMLRRSREDMDPRYAGRGGLTRFAEERGLNRRVAWDIENGKRDNYTRAMLRDIEGAYGLPRRAIDDFLTAEPQFADPRLQNIMDGPGDLEWRLLVVRIAAQIIARGEAQERSA